MLVNSWSIRLVNVDTLFFFQFSRQIMGPIIRLKNCRVLRGRKFQHEDLFVQDGKIINYLRVIHGYLSM